MRSIPVDTSAATVMLVVPPAPKLKDKRTGERSMDHETGAPMSTVTVNYIYDGAVELLTVAVPETGLSGEFLPGMLVALTGLVARPWETEFNGRKQHGISFRAVAVTALAPVGARG
ncbi:SCO3933 family regulatory protein [Yinghuangia sp. YIM S09857]|uniref:SCO3933 family regulatory protein n=1 Tax=Yinghuangia sp. YIM S09857 TaxID=3436929 RepID=UPI003F53AB44